jgi:Bacterial SH3 domain
MTRLASIGVAALLAAGFQTAPAFACGGPAVCTVKDPTGTPLNVRASPKGKILANLKNGQKVEIVDHQDIKGKRWARVGKYYEGELETELDAGWVFAGYLSCKGDVKALPDDFSADATGEITCTVKDPTGTPLNVRAAPGGEIGSTVRNGTVLRASLMKTHKGKPWVYVAKWGADNAIGWVFDPYLQCEEDGE